MSRYPTWRREAAAAAIPTAASESNSHTIADHGLITGPL
jgi:hypothetical protein